MLEKVVLGKDLDNIFNYFMSIQVHRLDIGYAVDFGFCAITDKGKPESEVFKMSNNHVRCLLRREILNDLKESKAPKEVKELPVAVIVKLLDMYMKHMNIATETIYKSGKFPEEFKRIDAGKVKEL